MNQPCEPGIDARDPLRKRLWLDMQVHADEIPAHLLSNGRRPARSS